MRLGRFADAAQEMGINPVDFESMEKASNGVNFMYDSAKGRAPWDVYLKAADVLSEAGF